MSLMGIFKGLKQRKRAGFTMAEVLVVVAVVGILAGIAIPSIISVQKNLKMTEADSAARSIYIAAQNRMSELRISGELTGLGGSVMAAPSDFPGELDWSGGEYLWLSSDDSAATELLFPAGALEAGLLSGTFYVEYNAAAGMVYSVFYSADDFFYSAALPRDSAGRKAHDPIVGYYGGSGLDYSGWEFALVPGWEIVNENELYILITPDSFDPDTYRLTLRDESGGEEIIEFKNGDLVLLPDMVTYDIINRQYTVLLDSLESGSQFKTLFSGLSAGDDISVTLAVIPGDSQLASAETKTVNSLFASRNGERVTVTYPRHLQNLHPAFSDVDSGVTEAFQGKEITWSADDFGQFIPIDNPNLKSFDGGNNPLRSFNAALFNNIVATEDEPAEIKNIRLIDSVVSSSAVNAGVLVNTVAYTNFTNCHVFSEEPASYEGCTLTSTAAQNTGGLVGLATSCNFEKCLASLTRISASTGAVGGLAGGLSGGAVKSCYADTGFWNLTGEAWHSSSGIISYGSNAGGLVGRTSGGRIENSYCAGNIQMKNTGGAASGFTGSSSGTAYANCYSASSFRGSETDNIYGFINSAALPSVSCYFLKTADIKIGDENGSGYGDLVKLFASNSAWAASSASVTEAYGRRADESPVYPFPRLSGMRHYGDWPDGELRLGEGLYYYEKYQNGQYGVHAAIGKEQIGTLRDTSVVLEDGYGILVEKGNVKPQYTVGSSNTRYTLADSAIEIQDEGSTFILYPINLANITTANAAVFYTRLVIAWDESVETWLNPSFAKAAVNENPGEAAPSRPDSFILRTARHLSRLSELSGSYYWNAVSGTNSARPYVQERDIDFSTYAASLSYSPIGSDSVNPFRGSYNGGGAIITGLDIRTSNDAGLFGHVAGGARLENIIFISDTDGSVVRVIEKTGDNGFVGGLAAVNGGTISNCAVAGFKISGGSASPGSVYVGGFVGQNTGTITNCSASNGYFDGSGIGGAITAKRGASASAAVGGFAGDNTGTITSCYAVGRIVITQALLDLADCYGFSGTSGGTITNSYCATIATSNAWWTTNDYLPFSPGAVHSSNKARSADYSAENLKNEDMGSAWGKASAINTHAYEAGRENESYPFPAIVKRGGAYVHYGNWPQDAIAISFENSAAYYERYADGSMGYYILDGGSVIDTLREDVAVVEDGYVLLSRQTPGAGGNYPSLTITSSLFSNNAMRQVSQTVAGTDFGVGGYAAYYLKPGGSILSFENNINMERSYAVLSATINGKAESFYYNPNYAKALGTSENAVSGERFEIRTARHLAQMAASINTYPSSAASAKWVAANYVQTRDIDFQTYSVAQTMTPIASTGHNNGFAGIYDGGGYVIAGVMQLQHGGATGTSGLFGTVDTGGIIRNVKFVAAGTGTPTVSGGQSSNDRSGTGAFVGRNRGTIENCSAAGFNVTGPVLVGGFVGANDGTIKNCSAANAAFAANDKGGSVRTTQYGWGVGGFAALNSGTIENCYAVSLLYPANGAAAYGFVADNSGTIADSYSVAINASGSYLAFGPTTPSGCYALGVGGVTADAILQAFANNQQWGMASAVRSYPYSTGLAGLAYPLPAVVKDAKVEFEHYGNWPPQAMSAGLSLMSAENGEAGEAAAPPVTEALPPEEPVTGKSGEENPE